MPVQPETKNMRALSLRTMEIAAALKTLGLGDGALYFDLGLIAGHLHSAANELDMLRSEAR